MDKKSTTIHASTDAANRSLQLRAAIALLEAHGSETAAAARSLAGAADADIEGIIQTATVRHPWLSACRLRSGSLIWFRVALEAYAGELDDAAADSADTVRRLLAGIDDSARHGTLIGLGRFLTEQAPPRQGDPSGERELAITIADDEQRLRDAIAKARSTPAPPAWDWIEPWSVLLRQDLPVAVARGAVRRWAELHD